MMNNNKVFFNWLQVGRFLAAFWVVMQHGQWQLFFPTSPVFPENVIYGHYGVDFFFVLSGFIITVTCQGYFGKPERLGEYFIKRFARIYPLVFLLCLPRIVLAFLGGEQLADTLQQFISDVLLLPNNTKHMINTAWSLRYEMFFYVAFGFFMILGKRFFWSAIGLATIVIFYYNLKGASFEGVDRFLFSKWNILFISGCVLGEVEPFFRQNSKRASWIAVILMVLGGYLLLSSGLSNSGHEGKSITDVVWSSIFFSGSIIGLCCLDYKGVKAPKILILLGNASYCIYLLHGSILFHIRNAIQQPYVECAVSWLAVALVLIVSCLIYLYYEKLTNNWLRKKWLKEN